MYDGDDVRGDDEDDEANVEDDNDDDDGGMGDGVEEKREGRNSKADWSNRKRTVEIASSVS